MKTYLALALLLASCSIRAPKGEKVYEACYRVSVEEVLSPFLSPCVTFGPKKHCFHDVDLARYYASDLEKQGIPECEK